MTDQIRERLIVDGVRMTTIDYPPLPNNSSLLELTPEAEIVGDCTGCWRGYVGTWEIEKGRLYLKAIDGPVAGLAPAWRMKSAERIGATWCTKILRAPQGPMLRFSAGYARELHFDIVEGRVVDRRTIDNRCRLVWSRDSQ